jgi:hypothetical protein
MRGPPLGRIANTGPAGKEKSRALIQARLRISEIYSLWLYRFIVVNCSLREVIDLVQDQS